MMLKIYFDISTGFIFSKISVECSVHLCSCPWTTVRCVRYFPNIQLQCPYSDLSNERAYSLSIFEKKTPLQPTRQVQSIEVQDKKCLFLDIVHGGRPSLIILKSKTIQYSFFLVWRSDRYWGLSINYVVCRGE